MSDGRAGPHGPARPRRPRRPASDSRTPVYFAIVSVTVEPDGTTVPVSGLTLTTVPGG